MPSCKSISVSESSVIQDSVATADATVTFLPEGSTIRVASGTTILHAARRAGVHIDAPCGEHARCGKCRVRITAGDVSALSPEETTLLTESDRLAGIRLACTARPLGSIIVDIPESSRNLARRKATAELHRPIAVDPFTRKIFVQVAAPSLSGGDLRDDLARLREQIPTLAGADLAALRALPGALATGAYQVTAVVAGDRLIAVEARDTSAAHYGLALDIGTTTVAGYLLDLRSGQELAAAARPNPQAAYGGDVISRASSLPREMSSRRRCCGRASSTR